MPQCSEEIHRYFVALVATEYCKDGEKKGKALRLSSKSDSTDASHVPGSSEGIRESMQQLIDSEPSWEADTW